MAERGTALRRSIVHASGPSGVRWPLLAAAGALLVVAVGLLVFQVLPDLFAPGRSPGFGVAAEAKARADVRTSALQLVGGLVIAIGAVLTARTVQLTQERNRIERESQITERFTRAIDQLGSEQLDICLGGIYALERIARDSPSDHWTIMEVLTAFVRGHAPYDPASDAPPTSWRPPRPTTDVQAVLTVLGRRITDLDAGQQLDLQAVDAQGAQLRGARFSHARLKDSRFQWAQLTDADLSWAALWSARLNGAVLHDAQLDHAFLMDAQLEGAMLDRASLTGALLTNARLPRATLSQANLTEAILRGADLSHAILEGTDLTRADLSRAQLRHAQLSGANLSGAELAGADLDGARYDDRTRWPTGFDPAESGALEV